MTGRVAGKVALVTGAASGIGRSCAELLAAEGAKVALTDIQDDKGREVAAAIGANAIYIPHDVTGEDAWIAVVEQVRAAFGRLDILVNNAGIGIGGPVTEFSLADWRRQQAINVEGVFLGVKHSLPLMRQGGGGSIINVSSIAGMTGLMGSPGAVAYTTTKAGLQGFTLSVAADYAVHGVRANCIIVGTVNTPMVAHLGEEARERRRKGVPLQVEGTGWDVGHAAVYLASDEARWVTGVMLPIDGGFLAVRGWPR